MYLLFNLFAHCVLKIGNNWLYKGHWQGKIWKICEIFFFRPAGWNYFLLPGMPETSRFFCSPSATARVAPDLLKALAILSDATVRRSAVDREDLKPYWKSEKSLISLGWSTILLFTSFSKTLLNTERRLSF